MNSEPVSNDEAESDSESEHDAKELAEYYRIYERRYDQLTQRASSNNENRDKTVVTVSGAVLALSVAYLRLVGSDVVWAPCLYFGWILFFAAIALTVISFHTGNKAIDVGLDQDYKYYVDRVDEDTDEENVWEILNSRVNIASSCCFLFGLLLVLIFLFRNGSGAHEVDLPKQDVLLEHASIQITDKAHIVINGDVAMSESESQKKAGPPSSSQMKSQGAGTR